MDTNLRRIAFVAQNFRKRLWCAVKFLCAMDVLQNGFRAKQKLLSLRRALIVEIQLGCKLTMTCDNKVVVISVKKCEEVVKSSLGNKISQNLAKSQIIKEMWKNVKM